MDTKEYFAELKGIEVDNFHPEFHTYVTAYIRARSPQLYVEVASRFKTVEREIHAKYECDDGNQF
jgi:hypothetical protein